VHLAAGHPPMVLRTNDHGTIEVPEPPKDTDASQDGSQEAPQDGSEEGDAA